MTSKYELVVVGQGYVGLPLAQEAVRSGLNTAGFDLNPRVVEGLNSGISHIDDLSDSDVQTMVDKGYVATTDASALSNTKTIVVCVPTPLSKDGSPDMSYIESATSLITQHVSPGTLISLESTTYPGTTDDLIRPMIEEKGFTVGYDIFLAYSPERINPGDPVYGFRNTPKVVGGATKRCADIATEFYNTIVDKTVLVSGTREAEMSKLLENTYRHVNIALVNELAQVARGLNVDLTEVIDAAKSKPFGFQAFYPGPGVGGHCIPIDPNYLSYTIKTQLGHPFRFVELAQEINSSMPAYVARRVTEVLNYHEKPVKNSNILLLGVTYKPNIADQRESPAIPLARILADSGANLSFHDPRVERWTYQSGRTIERVANLVDAVRASDIVVYLQSHSEYGSHLFGSTKTPVLDTKGGLRDLLENRHSL